MRSGPEPLPVRVRGTIYPSARAAAEAIGVTPSTVYSALMRGREDYIGSRNRNNYRGNPKPVYHNGVFYSNNREFAKAIKKKLITAKEHARRRRKQMKLLEEGLLNDPR